jgi:hypothetical protein
VCQEDDPAVLAFWQFLTAGCIGLASMLLTGGTPPWEQWEAGLLPVLYLGLFSTCLCYLLQTSAQRHVPPARAGVLLSTEGLFGSLFSVALGLEPLRPAMALGGLIIMLCVILMEWTPKKSIRWSLHYDNTLKRYLDSEANLCYASRQGADADEPAGGFFEAGGARDAFPAWHV